jgi:Pseudouridine synthase II TruB, C-terminal
MRRILLDQNVAFPLARQLVGHDVVRTSQRSWGQLTNGDLLATAQRNGFDNMISADHGIRHEQNHANRKIALVMLDTNRWPIVRQNPEVIRRAVDDVEPTGLIMVGSNAVPAGRRAHSTCLGVIPLDKLLATADTPPASPDLLLPVATALADIPALALTEAEANGLRHGQAISLVTLMGRIPGNAEPSCGLVRAMAGSRVVGLARLQDGWMKPERLL